MEKWENGEIMQVIQIDMDQADMKQADMEKVDIINEQMGKCGDHIGNID